MIDELENKYKDMSFDIIVPSYPGLGFSTPLYKPMTATDTALVNPLYHKLKLNRFNDLFVKDS